MGIIQRQSIKFSLVNLLGTLIGGVSMLFIYSLDDELYGYAQMLVSMAYLIIPLASFGISSVAIRFFRDFKNGTDNNGFLSLIMVITLITNMAFLILYYLFRESFYQFVDYLRMDSSKLQENESVILLLVLLINMSSLVIAFISNYKRIVVPAIIHQLGFKLFLPSIFLLAYFGWINVALFSFLIPMFYCLSLIVLIIYLFSLGGLRFSWKPQFYKSKLKEIRKYFFYSSLTSLGSSLTFRLDSVMIPLLLGYAPNGLYNKIYFMANVISIPTNSINQIANPIISESLKNNELQHIETIYKKSSVNLFLIGSYLYVGMILCLPSIFQLSILPSSFAGGIALFVVLGAGKLIDMLTSVNGAIISYSSHYKWNLYFILILGISNLLLNYILIQTYGVLGAAMATVAALVGFNLLKLVFIYLKFGMHPFSLSTIKIAVLFLLIFLLLYWIDFQSNPFFEILFNGSILTLLAAWVAYYWNISEEANEIMNKYLRKLNIIN